MRHTFFATCAPGLEPVLHAEVKALRLAKIERQVGGVLFSGTMQDAWRANLWLRTAVRVLLRLSRFSAATSDQLYWGAREIDWSQFVRPDGTLAVQAQSRDSKIQHSRFVAQRVKDAVADQIRERHGARPSVDRDDPDLRIHAHLFRDRATLSLDTSGRSLHLRGWRRHQGLAPLAETLAAGVVLTSDWDQRAPLLDPFCGSGTLLVEAALIAHGIAPGSWRSFGFERWPGHDADTWQRCRTEALQQRRTPRALRLIGTDLEERSIDQARENAAAAGVETAIELARADAREFAPRRGWNAWVVSNLPFGERVGEEADLGALLRDFGRALRERCAGYRYGLLSGNPELSAALELTAPQRVAILHGGIETELLCGEIE